MRTYLGIDVGKTGGIATFADGHNTGIRTPKTETEIAKYIRELNKDCYLYACVEKVHAMPNQGVTSMFNFGKSFGMILGILETLEIPYFLVTPQRWQKRMLPEIPQDLTTKERSLDLARHLFPDVSMKYKKDDGIADALHLAMYAQLYYEEELSEDDYKKIAKY